jgi:hypothetical protein
MRGVLPQHLVWEKESHVPGDSDGPPFPPCTRLLRILAQSMTDNQGPKNGEGMPNGLDNTVGLSLRFNWLPVLLIILTARKIMRKRI